MRWFPALLLAATAWAQQAPFTLNQVLGFAFPSELAASPSGAKVAWVSNMRGLRNIMVAEPPGYAARAVTAFTQDDGQDIQHLRWTGDSSALVFVRGAEANPELRPDGVSEDVWVVALNNSAPRRIGSGNWPEPSPNGGTLAYISGNQVWTAPLNGSAPPAQAFKTRGVCQRPVWSPDGSRIALTVERGDHSFVGVFSPASRTLRFLDPGVYFDSEPAWSPDGRSIAFLRIPSTGLRQVREARRAGDPWSIRIVPAEGGQGHEIWRANEGPGSVFREMRARNQVLWAGDRIVFPWEGDGWLHLYSVQANGGKALPLTPGDFEIEDAALLPGNTEILYSSNQGDPDRRHLWRTPVAASRLTPVTVGSGIESYPAPLSDGTVAFLQADARHPLQPAIQQGRESRALDPQSLAADFPLQRVITPQPVSFPSTDKLYQIHGQILLPPNASGRNPAVVFFHGGPRRQMLLGWNPMQYYSNAYAFNQYLANSGFIVLSINFRSGTGYGMEFRESPGFGASGSTEFFDIQGAADYLRSRADVDPARIGAWGGSYGGYLTALALARASDVFRVGVDFHGVHDWAAELRVPKADPDYKVAFDASPMAFLKTWRSPVLLIHGDDDPDVQFNQTVMLASALRRQKVEVEELIFPDEVHEFLLYRDWLTAYARSADFLIRRLK
jgi:dipeptidyl aminopeptidase/acylaminoacyl peptidase